MVFSVGAMGALGTAALALRAQTEGERAAAAADLANATLDSLWHRAAATTGGCATVASGTAAGPRGTTVEWRLQALPHGLSVRLAVGFPTPRGRHADTLWSYLPCR
jgi:hypothetical protein